MYIRIQTEMNDFGKSSRSRSYRRNKTPPLHFILSRLNEPRSPQNTPQTERSVVQSAGHWFYLDSTWHIRNTTASFCTDGIATVFRLCSPWEIKLLHRYGVGYALIYVPMYSVGDDESVTFSEFHCYHSWILLHPSLSTIYYIILIYTYIIIFSLLCFSLC